WLPRNRPNPLLRKPPPRTPPTRPRHPHNIERTTRRAVRPISRSRPPCGAVAVHRDHPTSTTVCPRPPTHPRPPPRGAIPLYPDPPTSPPVCPRPPTHKHRPPPEHNEPHRPQALSVALPAGQSVIAGVARRRRGA